MCINLTLTDNQFVTVTLNHLPLDNFLLAIRMKMNLMDTLHILEIMKRIPDTSFTETFLSKKYVSFFPTISIGTASNKGTAGK
jgi:hypothetical protein